MGWYGIFSTSAGEHFRDGGCMEILPELITFTILGPVSLY